MRPSLAAASSSSRPVLSFDPSLTTTNSASGNEIQHVPLHFRDGRARWRLLRCRQA